MPGGSPAAPRRQANVPLMRNNDLPYGFSCPPILSRTRLELTASFPSYGQSGAHWKDRANAIEGSVRLHF